ncbi:hypothetical protein C4N15_03170 [Fusobacterium necrophorum subsp. funduliforme]|uniref:hypothetical protein n=1 Tax=Fusobacterium necrophorum TaxID=859 RepID=UPI000461997F|nr:hypothetical protein [Fusobacterium necrophorum]AVQ20694.1 hypothetical protein C4N15_03170 [Fusobacterium necrophorum subsp. funduliforme]KDE68159.1 hypothetical protein FUSO7_13475 [Fusobacterium necrophorum BFTR-2]
MKENFTEAQAKVLELYIKLEVAKFGNTKKQKYEEIQRRTKQSINTITSWIYRYLEDFKKYIQEIEKKEKNAIISNFKGLTEKQTKYVLGRMNGIGKKEAAILAGYSPKTKVANIEKAPMVANTMEKIRQKYFNDECFGAEAQLNHLKFVIDMGKAGVKTIEYIDEKGPEGTLQRKTIKHEYPLQAINAAVREVNSMLGYNYMDEMRAEQLKKKKQEQLVLIE